MTRIVPRVEAFSSVSAYRASTRACARVATSTAPAFTGTRLSGAMSGNCSTSASVRTRTIVESCCVALRSRGVASKADRSAARHRKPGLGEGLVQIDAPGELVDDDEGGGPLRGHH